MGNFRGKIPKSLNPKSAPLPQSADSAMSSTSARCRTARAPRPLPPPSDRAMTSTSAPRRSARGPAAQTVLPDEIWEEIFLRLDAAADLARASAACSSFHRIVSEHRFLRRFRSLRSPAVLGFISRDRLQFVPVEPPHRSAPEARALELAADSTFSFLPGPHAWDLRHARDGRVLVSRRISAGIGFEHFVVCDPLHRRYVEIPRIPGHLRPSPNDLVAIYRTPTPCFGPVLAPAGENDEERSFRVIRTVQIKIKVMAFVFSSCNQTWTGITRMISLPKGFIEYVPYYAHDCIYWVDYRMGYSLMLDTGEMEFSVIDLPPHNRDSMCAIVEAEEGRLGFLTIGDGTIDLYCKNWQRNGVGAQEWQHNKRIPLPKDSGINYCWEIEGTTGRYLALVAHHIIGDESPPNSEHFLLDMKTLLVEKLCTSNNGMFYGFPYARFPPLLAYETSRMVGSICMKA